IGLFQSMWDIRHGDFVFGGRFEGKPINESAMLATLGEMNAEGQWRDPDQDNRLITVHGFRSSFRTYVEEKLSVDSVLADACLAHGKTDKTLEAYQRGPLLEKRRIVMEAWARFAIHGDQLADNVVHIGGKQ